MQLPRTRPVLMLSLMLLVPAALAAETSHAVAPTALDPASTRLSIGVGRSDGGTAVEQVSDEVVSESVRATLESTPETANQSVGVATSKGVVTLSGKASDERFKGRIIQVVQGVRGVRCVRNHLILG